MTRPICNRRAFTITGCVVLCAAVAGCPQWSPHRQTGGAVFAVDELVRRGVFLLRSGDQDSIREAEAAFLLAGEAAPNDPRVFDGIGCIALRRGRVDEAKRYFQKATMESPRYDRAVAHLADVAYLEGRNEEAKELFERALQLNPLGFRARNNYAVALVSIGAPGAKVETELRKARLSAPHEPIIQRNISVQRNTVIRRKPALRCRKVSCPDAR